MKKYPFYHLLKTGDKIIVFLVLIISILSFYYFSSFQSEGNFIEIQVDGKLVQKLPLDKTKQIIVDGPVGQTTISINNNKAEIIQSDCPYKICIKSGSIHRSGQALVCVPNRVFVRVVNGNNDHFDVIVE